MKKIILTLLLTPMLSFSSLATETQPVNTSGTDNNPTSSQNCEYLPHCSIRI
jgi:hypothetical protein